MSQQGLAAVKVEMENRVDQLHSQLNLWQSVTVDNFFKTTAPLSKQVAPPTLTVFICKELYYSVDAAFANVWT